LKSLIGVLIARHKHKKCSPTVLSFSSFKKKYYFTNMTRKLARKLQAVNEVLRITKKKLDGFNSRPMVSELDGGRVKDIVSLRLIALSNR
jgi:hypothetical protein